ncbi:Tn3 family transposase, partial [Deinococcus frigens]
PQNFATFADRVLALVPREQLQAAADTVDALTRPRGETRLESLLSRYSYVQQFLPTLLKTVEFEAGSSGQSVLAALQALRGLERRGQVSAAEVPLTLVKGSWERLIARRGPLHRGAYTLCVLEHLQAALKRRDLYVPASPRFHDPRLRLLSSERWTALRAEVCRSLDLDPDPQVVLARLSAQLDERYRLVEARLPENAAVTLEERDGQQVLILQEDGALPEPPSLKRLRGAVADLMPRLDLPDLLLEVHGWTGFASAFTHLSEGRTRVDHLAVSVCAVLLAEACNVGLEAVIQPETGALRRGRLAWVDQHYLRAETIASANTRLVDFQSTIPTVSRWGDGQVASVDGLRFRVPVKTIYAGQNPKYFGVRSGVTYLNFISDQYSGFHSIVVPGTLRDSLFALDGMIEQNTALQPRQLISDTAASSYMVFGLFRLLGYQFSPELADLRERRYGRMSREADYGKLNALASAPINTRLIAAHWDDLLRIAGSLMTRTVRASELLKVIGVSPKSSLVRALEHFGRIASTLHLLSYHDDPVYRRTIGTQRNRQEARHRLGRAVFQGRQGELRQHYVAGMEDQLGALGLVINAIILWNARYLDRALDHLRAQGVEVREEDVQRLSPLKFEHLHLGGRYHFPLTPPLPEGQFRKLRDPDEPEE